MENNQIFFFLIGNFSGWCFFENQELPSELSHWQKPDCARETGGCLWMLLLFGADCGSRRRVLGVWRRI